MALEQNRQLKIDQLSVNYQQALLKTGKVLPQANFFFEAGQINSIYTDTKFGMGQSFYLPAVYSKQTKLLEAELRASQFQKRVSETDLKRQVATVYYLLVYQYQKLAVLAKSDSLYRGFLERATQRLKAGETTVLEKTSAEIQLNQISMKIARLRADASVAELQLQWLLRSERVRKPVFTATKYVLSIAANDTLLAEHPLIQLANQKLAVAAAQTEAEKTKLLPELNLTYNNTSMRGVGADDVHYGAGKRFHAAQIGVGIPIFQGAQRAKIKSSEINEKRMDRNNYRRTFNLFG